MLLSISLPKMTENCMICVHARLSDNTMALLYLPYLHGSIVTLRSHSWVYWITGIVRYISVCSILVTN